MKKIGTILLLSAIGVGFWLLPSAMYTGGKCKKCKCEVFVSKKLSSTCICGHAVTNHENGKSNAPKL